MEDVMIHQLVQRKGLQTMQAIMWFQVAYLQLQCTIRYARQFGQA